MQFLQITLQHMGHRAEFYGAIKLSAEHWKLFPLHRPLYLLLTTVPPWHLVVFMNIFVPLKLSWHLFSAPQAEGVCWYYCLFCGCMRSSTGDWSTVLSWDSISYIGFEGCQLQYAFCNDEAVQNMLAVSFRRSPTLWFPTGGSTTVRGRDAYLIYSLRNYSLGKQDKKVGLNAIRKRRWEIN